MHLQGLRRTHAVVAAVGGVFVVAAIVTSAAIADATAPPNDSFYVPQAIEGVGGSIDGTNENATAQWDEPYSPVQGGHSVWYVWTSPRNGTVTFTATSSVFQPAVTIYQGDSTDRLVRWSEGYGSATVDAQQNQAYRIAVDGANTGPFALAWAYAATGAPPNDYFADAEPIEGADGSVTGSNANATVEPGEPDHSGGLSSGGHSVWFRWTAPAAGEVTFTTQGSGFDTLMRAYSGTSVDALYGQGWYDADLNPWTNWSRVILGVHAGEVYSIAVDGQNGATGEVALGWHMTLSSDDTQLPTIHMTSPPPSATVNGTVTFTSDAADDSAVDRVEYQISPNSGGNTSVIGWSFTAPYEVSLDTSLLPDGVYSVNAVAYDTSGNSASDGFSITIQNTAPPTITVPADMRVEATSSRGAIVKYSATARDYRGTAIGVVCQPKSGSLFPLGTTTVQCQATDADGRTSSKRFRVTVVDTTPPLISAADVVANATSPGGASVTYTVTATDKVDGSVTPSCTPESGASYVIGDTTVTCAAEDSRGNHSSASFTVHVKDAAEQTTDLRALVASWAIAKPDAQKLDDAFASVQASLADGRSLTTDQSARVVTDASRIRAVLGC